MARFARPAAVAAVLALALVACGEAKTTGLPKSPTPEPVPQTSVAATAGASFDPKELEIKSGETVTWVFEAILHNVKFTTIPVDSHPDCVATDANTCGQVGEKFEHAFEDAGEFAYYCVIHGTAAGQGMAGTIVVAAE
ncbi:MAG TPA: plastocyanin/azurin family copper-binding protein [Actinomycetota bacterium]